MDFEPRPRVLSFQSVVTMSDEDASKSSAASRRFSGSSTASSRRISAAATDSRKGSRPSAYISPYSLWKTVSDSVTEAKNEAKPKDENQPTVENTYRTEPKRTFPESEVQEVVRNTLGTMLDEQTYSAQQCSFLTKTLSSRILQQVKKLNIERYKLVCLVSIGSKCNQGLRIASRCLWSEEFDTHVSASFENRHLFAVATVYGVYFE